MKLDLYLISRGFFWPSAKKLKGLKTQTQGFWHQNSRIFRLKTQQTGKSLKQKLPVMKCEVHRHCPSGIRDPTFGSGIWVRNRGSGIFPDLGKIPWIRNFHKNQYSLPRKLSLVNFGVKIMVLRGKFLVQENFPGSGKFQTLDSGPKFRTRRLGPECQMGRANIRSKRIETR